MIRGSFIAGEIARYAHAAALAGAELVAVEPNLIDLVWEDRPKPPQGEITLHAPRYAGEPSQKKLARIVAALNGKDALVVSDPHAVAWAFNIRGQDVSHTPLPLSFAIIARTGKPKLYVDFEKYRRCRLEETEAARGAHRSERPEGRSAGSWQEGQAPAL